MRSVGALAAALVLVACESSTTGPLGSSTSDSPVPTSADPTVTSRVCETVSIGCRPEIEFRSDSFVAGSTYTVVMCVLIPYVGGHPNYDRDGCVSSGRKVFETEPDRLLADFNGNLGPELLTTPTVSITITHDESGIEIYRFNGELRFTEHWPLGEPCGPLCGWTTIEF